MVLASFRALHASGSFLTREGTLSPVREVELSPAREGESYIARGVESPAR